MRTQADQRSIVWRLLMFRNTTAILISMLLTLSGCATLEKSVFLGSGIGVGLGGGIGLLASGNSSPQQKTQGALIGAAIAGLLGGLIGYQSYKDKKRKEISNQADLNSAGLEIFGGTESQGGRPKLRPAQIKVRYVEDLIKDGAFIPAHLEYEISEPARWEKSK